MSFVSHVLERIGVLAPEAPKDPEPSPEAPSQPLGALDPIVEDDVYASAPTLPPTAGFSVEELAAFDPEQTQRSAALADMAETTAIGETTQVGSAPEVTAVSTSGSHQGTTRITLQELLGQRGLGPRIGDSQLDLAARRGLDATYEQIFANAGLGPTPGGWTVDRARDVIRRGRADGMTPAQVRFLLEEALVRDGATPRDVAADAVAKDEILDAYEQALAARVDRAIAEKEREAEALAERIRALREQRDDVLAEIAQMRERFAQWREDKQKMEREWGVVLEVLAPFLAVSE